MLYQIKDGTVSVGGTTILSHIDFEIRGNEKIAVVGKNGAGKTTLLKLIAGELELDRDDKRTGPGITCSRRLTIGMLHQYAFSDDSRTVEEELLSGYSEMTQELELYSRERFEYEQEYDRLFTGFGFQKEDKRKPLTAFSGGEQTKIALIKLLLSKPDILLLDEPTNHLDLDTSQWLESYMREYPCAVVMVSHDRFFLDRTADVVYEMERGTLTRYAGNYTCYRQEKRKRNQLQKKAYEEQQAEIKRLEDLIERFRHKPNKAAFARSRKKILERMPRIEKTEEEDASIFTGEIQPEILGSKWIFESEHLKIGYEKPIMEITMRIRRGQKIGILGPNGAGKTTFLKTVAGLIPSLKGEYSLGNQVTIGYFDQHSAEIESEQSVLEHFHNLFPSLTEKETRSILGGYLFGGKEAAKTVSSLSGGEKSRLVLAELLQSRPNFLILDEPTNHMDIRARETLESAFQCYKGTILFVSHDRYFIKQVAESILIFENQTVLYYPFGYEHYLERTEKMNQHDSIPAQMKAEEQALIAGMRAVPKAERHRLRELSTEEAYQDWVLRLAGEKLAVYERKAEEAFYEMKLAEESWYQSEEFWNQTAFCDTEYGKQQEPDALTRSRKKYEDTWKDWDEQCMEWYETENSISQEGI